MASGSNDNVIRVWNYNTFDCIKVFKWHLGWIQQIINIDEHLIASISDDKYVNIWKFWSGKIKYSINT